MSCRSATARTRRADDAHCPRRRPGAERDRRQRPADPATAEADARRTDYAAALSTDALRGERIGVMRFASGFGTDAGVRGSARDPARAGRDAGRDRPSSRGAARSAATNSPCCCAELKADLNAYLATTAARRCTTRTLADLIAFNAAACRPRAGAVRPGHCSSSAEATQGLDDAEYRNGARDLACGSPAGRASTRLLREA